MAKQEQQKQSKRTVYSAATDENSVLERQSHCFLNRVRYKNHLLPQRTLENALLSYFSRFCFTDCLLQNKYTF